MAKIRHRVFEIYELREEAIGALTRRSDQTATETTASESWKYRHFAVKRATNMAHVKFQCEQTIDKETTNEIREDLGQLADRLVKDSRVLLDFSAVEAFDAASIEALVKFKRSLQIKGSQIAICCLDPAVKESFFDRNNGHE